MVGEYLAKHGIRPSLQRIAIMEYLQEHRTHPTADEIYSALSPSIPTLSKMTVYNTLNLFVAAGVTLCLNIEGKNAHFDGDVSDHAHFICKRCGRIFDIPMEEAGVASSVAERGFEVEEVHLYYKGCCKECRTNNEERNSNHII